MQVEISKYNWSNFLIWGPWPSLARVQDSVKVDRNTTYSNASETEEKTQWRLCCS